MVSDQEIARLESQIAQAELEILRIKDEIAQLNDALTNLSLDAADRRAGNAMQGRGLGGMLFGSKFRGAVRRASAADNARLSAEVATRKREISYAKQALKSQERAVRTRLAELKSAIRTAKATKRVAPIPITVTAPAPNPPSPPAAPTEQMTREELKVELQKLKAMYERGSIDAAEYELERIKLLSPFT